MRWVKDKLTKIQKLDGGPRKIAIGIGIGIFIGFLPPLGLKTLLAMGIARLSRGHVVAAAIAVTLHDLLIPIAPVILIWEYKLGSLVLGIPPGSLPDFKLSFQDLISLINWSNLIRLEAPLIVGGTIIGLPFGIIAYFITLRLLSPPPEHKPPAPSGSSPPA